MRALTRIHVVGLLGRFEHDVSFPPEDSFVILHGPNGVGKTHLLQLVQAVLSREFWRIDTIRFSRLTLDFSDNHQIIVEKSTSESAQKASRQTRRRQVYRRRLKLDITLMKGDNQLRTWSPSNEGGDSEGPRSRLYRLLDSETPLERYSPDEWIDLRTSYVYSTEEAVSKFLTSGDPAQSELLASLYRLPEELSMFFEDLSVKFVETQRLLVDESRNERLHRRAGEIINRQSTVVQFSQHLAALISKNLAENSKISSELDRTFPKRVLERRDVAKITNEALLAKYHDQTILRNRLAEVALLDRAPDISLQDRDFDPTERRVLATYLEDAEKKLGAFRENLEKITLLREIINERFLFKTLQIDARSGFVFETDEGETIAPWQLSSGEQHELVLLYELLFRTPRGAVVLIDEPEISLHVKWQREFLNDLQDVAKLSALRFVIATHSPQIVDRWHSKAKFLAPGEDWQ